MSSLSVEVQWSLLVCQASFWVFVFCLTSSLPSYPRHSPLQGLARRPECTPFPSHVVRAHPQTVHIPEHAQQQPSGSQLAGRQRLELVRGVTVHRGDSVARPPHREWRCVGTLMGPPGFQASGEGPPESSSGHMHDHKRVNSSLRFHVDCKANRVWSELTRMSIHPAATPVTLREKRNRGSGLHP